MPDCLFCRIVNKEIPADFVYEDDTCVVFADIAPVSLGHLLVVPRAHHENLLDTPDETLAHLAVVVKKVAAAAVEATGADGFNLGANTGAAAGQIVMHTHLHVMPRHAGDGLVHWPKRDVTMEQVKETAAAVRERLAS